MWSKHLSQLYWPLKNYTWYFKLFVCVITDARLCECRYVHGFWWKRCGRGCQGGVSVPLLLWLFWCCWIVLPHWGRASRRGEKWGINIIALIFHSVIFTSNLLAGFPQLLCLLCGCCSIRAWPWKCLLLYMSVLFVLGISA